MILIGNGTGLAGLRALLKARLAAGRHRNWLVFGERQAAHDWFCRAEIEGWRDAGQLERLDAVFSRDQEERRYVQHLLREQAHGSRLDRRGRGGLRLRQPARHGGRRG